MMKRISKLSSPPNQLHSYFSQCRHSATLHPRPDDSLRETPQRHGVLFQRPPQPEGQFELHARQPQRHALLRHRQAAVGAHPRQHRGFADRKRLPLGKVPATGVAPAGKKSAEATRERPPQSVSHPAVGAVTCSSLRSRITVEKSWRRFEQLYGKNKKCHARIQTPVRDFRFFFIKLKMSRRREVLQGKMRQTKGEFSAQTSHRKTAHTVSSASS